MDVQIEVDNRTAGADRAALGTLIARLRHHIRVRLGAPEAPPPSRDAQLEADVARWLALEDLGTAVLIALARGLRLRSLPTAAPGGAWYARGDRFSGKGTLRPHRRRTHASDWTGAGAVCMLAAIGAADAAAALLPVFAREPDDRFVNGWGEALAAYFAALGEEALPLLRDRITDRDLNPLGRAWVAHALCALAKAHERLRPACVEVLCLTLAPGYAVEPEDEAAAAGAVEALLGLDAAAALPRIEDAFARDAIDPQTLRLPQVLEVLAPERAQNTAVPQVAPLTLPLRCDACGRHRDHPVRTVFIATNVRLPVGGDLNTADLEGPEEGEVAARYGSFVVPHPVRCPHCGLINRYRCVTSTYAQMMAWLDAQARGRPTDPGVHLVRAASEVGPVHPLVAALRYRRVLAAEPENHDLRLLLAGTLRTAGQWAEAEQEYRSVVAAVAAPRDLRAVAATSLAILAAAADRPGEVADWCRIGLGQPPLGAGAVAGVPPLAARPGQPTVRPTATVLRGLLDEALDARHFDADSWYSFCCSPQTGLHIGIEVNRAPQAQPRPTKVGRNDPCPCGSGKKYKKCCGA